MLKHSPGAFKIPFPGLPSHNSRPVVIAVAFLSTAGSAVASYVISAAMKSTAALISVASLRVLVQFAAPEIRLMSTGTASVSFDFLQSSVFDLLRVFRQIVHIEFHGAFRDLIVDLGNISGGTFDVRQRPLPHIHQHPTENDTVQVERHDNVLAHDLAEARETRQA